MENNKCNFAVTILTQTLFSIVSVSVSILMMLTIESIEETDPNKIKQSAVILTCILITYLSFGYVQKVFRNRYLKCGLSQFKHHIFKRILSKSIREFGTSSSGKIINAFSNDLSSIELNYLDGTLQMIQQMIKFVLAVIIMFYLNRVLAVCVLLACIIPSAFSLVLGKRLVQKERKTSDEGEGFVEQVKDLLNGFTVIKSFKAEKEILELFDHRNFSLEEAKRERRDSNDTVNLASTFSSILVISMIFSIGLYFAFNDIISIGAIIAFVELSHFATQPMEKFFPLVSNRKAAIELVNKIADVISTEIVHEQKTVITGLEDAITLNNVSFSYGKDKKVLENTSLKFEKNKSYAIVGGSGSGKSTLIQLLLGYYEDCEGDIYYDDKKLSEIALDSLYDLVSIIQQNVFLFDSDIRNNITMFKEFDEDSIQKAVQLSGLSQLVDEKGMDYSCGTDGKNLSGGEKQRISIARCLIRHTPILLMDEATAALDNQTAYEIEQAILNLKQITKIIVTHKFNRSIIQQYDEIIVLKEGKVVECGNFQELVQKKGYFYSLYQIAVA